MKLILHDKMPSWNELYTQKHWSRRAALADIWKAIVWSECQRQGLKPINKYPIALEIVTNQRCDLDNLCIKLVIDGLKATGVIEDDDPKHIDMIAIKHDKTQEYTTIELLEYA